MSQRVLSVGIEDWPMRGQFAISRGARTKSTVVVATVTDGAHRGRGECVPYPHYGESPEGVRDAILGLEDAIGAGLDRAALQSRLRPGAARNALDCALWDLEARTSGMSVAELAGIAPLTALETAYTLGLDSPEAMARKAREAAGYNLLKIKLGARGDIERLEAIRAARPDARLIVDANEGWSLEALGDLLGACAAAGVELVEQPLKAAEDAALAAIGRPVCVCADESAHDRGDLQRLAGRYDAVNVKLDKTGGLTEALAMIGEARAAGLGIMVGCMVGTSLAMAPAVLAAQGADVVDLDGPLLLERDRDPGLTYSGGVVSPPEPELWG